MSQANVPATPASPAGAAPPRRPAASAPAGRRTPTATIDPVRILRQHLWLLVGSAFAGAVLGVVVNYVQLLIYPVWSGTVVFEITPEISDATNVVTREIAQEDTVARIGQTESRRIVSKSILESAMKAPDIGRTAWGQKYPEVDERIEELEKTLRVGHVRGTSNFVLSWSTQVKEDIPVVLNRVANVYIETRNNEENERALRSLGQFEDKRRALDEEIRRQSDAIQSFIGKYGLTGTITRGGEHLEMRAKIENTSKLRDEAIQMLTSMKTQLLLTDRKIEEGTFEEQDRRKAMEDFSIKQIEQQLHVLQVQLQSRRQRYGPEHPELKSIERAEQAARERMESAIRETMQRNLMADKMMFTENIARYEAVVQKQTEDLATDEKKLQDLTMRATELETLQKQLEQKQADRAKLQEMINSLELLRVREDSQRVKLRQLAVVPREISFPKLQYYIPLGMVLALGLVAGIIFLREFMDQRIKQPSDLLGLAGCRLLGVVPDLSDDPSKPERAERVVRTHPNSVTAEMFRQVASQARKTVDTGALRTIAVVAAHPDAGTTTLISNLATSAAAAGRRVAVVDANFRRPGLAVAFGADPDAPGLGNMLMGEEVRPQMVDGVAVFGTGPAGVRVFERLSGDSIGRALATLRAEYDLVLVDLPPMLVAGESLVVVHASDASLLVVRAMQDQRGLVGKMIGQLLDTRAALVGCVLMRPPQTVGGYFRKNAELMAEYAQEKSAT
jgi:uncharacterized protein involved in exopolysaccharide biosynthesis/Mrp family chromosome partitioning ATPase